MAPVTAHTALPERWFPHPTQRLPAPSACLEPPRRDAPKERQSESRRRDGGSAAPARATHNYIMLRHVSLLCVLLSSSFLTWALALALARALEGMPGFRPLRFSL